MQRIPTLLHKLHELAANREKNTEIEIDLMLDYTRVLYADLLEWRKTLAFKIPVMNEPTLAEMADVLTEEQKELSKSEKDIRNNIGINDKFLFTADLFNNDAKEYEATLDEINNSDNYQQVYNWLQNRFDQKENTTAELFYGVLSSFFSSR